MPDKTPSTYSLKIIGSKITNESYIGNKPVPGPKNWEKLLAVQNENLIVSNKKELALVDVHGKPVWKKSITCPGTPNDAWVSGNRLLVTTNTDHYHAWGHLGPAMLIDLDKGLIIKEFRGSQGEALSNGQFLLGLEGYEVFDTWMYGAKGELIKQWRSYGHYIIGKQNDIRVIEQDRRDPTNAHVVRLKQDGTIEKGTKLETSFASKPIVFNNGDIVFVNLGKLKIVDLGLNLKQELQLLKISKSEAWRYISKIRFHEGKLNVEIFERTIEPPIQYQKHEWLIEF